jgi:HD-GYP domain-containing protein (c-di-GMP phosphodiesterase class II)
VLGASFVMYERRAADDLDVVTGWRLPPALPRRLSSAGSPGLDVIVGGGDDARIMRHLDESAYATTSPLVTQYGAGTFIAFPVRAAEHPVGAICAVFDIDARPRPSQLDVFRVLGRVTSVEEDRRVANEEGLLSLALLEQAMERTVATLSAAVSALDPYTAGHERRVASIAEALAPRLGIEGERLRLLRIAATVHDLGKIVVPAELLSKPSRLSEAEFAIVRTHSAAGADLLKPAELPDVILDAVLQHHERLDGSGYPLGLAGDEIGEFGRVLAVADVVEAMSSHRPYRPGLGIDAALEEIELGSGSRYDARVCDACLSLFREDGFVIPE